MRENAQGELTAEARYDEFKNSLTAHSLPAESRLG